MRGGPCAPCARQRRGTHLAQHALQVGAQHRHQVQGRGWAAAGRRHGAGVGLPQASGRLRQRRQAGGAAGGREGAAGASARCWTFSLDVLHRKGVPGAAQGRWRLTLKVDWRDAGDPRAAAAIKGTAALLFPRNCGRQGHRSRPLEVNRVEGLASAWLCMRCDQHCDQSTWVLPVVDQSSSSSHAVQGSWPLPRSAFDILRSPA